jgi:sulfur carrier protein ThiS
LYFGVGLSINSFDQNKNSAIITLDYPLVKKKLEFQVQSGQTMQEALKNIEIRPGFSFVILVNGQVADQNVIINPGDKIHCLPQILGGML